MAPEVAVVVPTFNRVALLPEMLDALLAQDGVEHEVVVVDDGSHDATYDYLMARAADDDRLKAIRTSNGGPARARNLGWRHASAAVVAFTDDDCIPQSDWLARLIAGAGGIDIAQGRTRAREADGPRTRWDRTLTVERFSGRYETCNLLVRRELLERLGGFDERFPAAWGEDADLGLRAVRAGARAGFVDDAVVDHRVFPRSYLGYLADRPRFTQTVALVRYNPDARSLLSFRVAFKPSHLAVWAVTPFVLGAPWLGTGWVVPAGLVAWEAWHVYRTRSSTEPWTRRAARAPGALFATVYETACFALASIRHRTLVL